MCKKVLVLGGTGAMGVYMVPELIRLGFQVDVYALDSLKSDNDKLNYYVANVKDFTVLSEIAAKKYDAVVDFMVWPGQEFYRVADLFLENTDHYLYLSSYRIYADEEHPIKETSPRLYDIMAARDPDFYATDDYSLYKAKGEDYLINSGKNNWTIIRPAVTYSKRRVQLGTLEGYAFVDRARQGKKVLFPKEALDKYATMSWAGDVGKMIARLVLNPVAFGEAYTASTAEAHTWAEIAEYYKELIGLDIHPVDTETYINVLFDEDWRKAGGYQLKYDRLFDRIIDNSKILAATGMKQSELMPLFEGLKIELSGIDENTDWIFPNKSLDIKMDEFLEENDLQ